MFALCSVVFACALAVAPGEMGASTVGVLFGAQQIVTAFCPALVGLVADHAGLGAAVLLAAVFSLALAGALVVAVRPLLKRAGAVPKVAAGSSS